MFKKKAKAEAAADTDAPAAPKKRSKLKLALLALAPLMLAGGAYGGWIYFMAAPPQEAHAEDNQGVDPQKVAALKAAADAETSATYSYALGELMKPDCGTVKTPALLAASEAEAETSGRLVNMSWLAASRRIASVTEKSCIRLRSEVLDAEKKAVAGTMPAKDAPKGGGGHH